jgi:hypothetical protein
MAELLVLEFDSETATKRWTRPARSRFSNRGPDDWPADLITHVVAMTEDGAEAIAMCESRQAQQEFVRSRLGAAMAGARVTATPRRERPGDASSACATPGL